MGDASHRARSLLGCELHRARPQGAKTGEFPILQLTPFELMINFKTARICDITIPQSLLLCANEVIQ